MIRHNFMTNATASDNFIRGCLQLKAEPLGNGGLSTYDYFVWWHHRAMMVQTPPNTVQTPNPFNRNSAHSGPVFGPWHRYLLLVFEFQMRRILNDDDFRLPYWDWGTESGDPDAVWHPELLGDAVGVVNTGEFRSGGNFLVNIAQDGNRNAFDLTRRPLRRNLGALTASPPTNADVRAIVQNNSVYAMSPWDDSPSTGGFRRQLEMALHNMIHQYVGGHMMDSTSPNDPVFWLHHSNIDRIWSAWQSHHGSPYLPQTGSQVLDGHRFGDRLHSFLDQTVSPSMLDNHAPYYQYDSLTDVTP